MTTESTWTHQWLDHFAMDYYGDSDEYQSEAEALAAAREKLAQIEEEKGKNELSSWIYVVGPDGNGYRVNP